VSREERAREGGKGGGKELKEGRKGRGRREE
jgi:hypothetical protein